MNVLRKRFNEIRLNRENLQIIHTIFITRS